MASTTALLLLLGVLCVGFASAQIMGNCCMTVTQTRIPLRIIESYTIQEAGDACPISATLFMTKHGKMLCVSHPDNKLWVRNYIRHLDEERINK